METEYWMCYDNKAETRTVNRNGDFFPLDLYGPRILVFRGKFSDETSGGYVS
jgi:hypothetical protein